MICRRGSASAFERTGGLLGTEDLDKEQESVGEETAEYEQCKRRERPTFSRD
jgi:hypothetical protein